MLFHHSTLSFNTRFFVFWSGVFGGRATAHEQRDLDSSYCEDQRVEGLAGYHQGAEDRYHADVHSLLSFALIRWLMCSLFLLAAMVVDVSLAEGSLAFRTILSGVEFLPAIIAIHRLIFVVSAVRVSVQERLFYLSVFGVLSTCHEKWEISCAKIMVAGILGRSS